MPSTFTPEQWEWEVKRMQDLLANDIPKQNFLEEKLAVWDHGFDVGYNRGLNSTKCEAENAAKDTNSG